MPADSIAERLSRQGTFVFKGTIRRLNAAAMPQLTADGRTAIVLVDEILQAPAAFASFAGKEITVQIGGRKKIASGDKALFFANSWRFGEGIAVRAIDFLPADYVPSPSRVVSHAPTAVHGLTPARPPATEALANQELQRHVEAADVVVTGRVMAVRAPSEAASGPAVRGASLRAGEAKPSAQPQRISEHDPLWHEAVVEVTGVEKGPGAAKQIVVRFPSSRDVRWYKAPKFTPGQEGVFILRKSTEVSSSPTRMRAAGRAQVQPEVYSAEDSADFQPMHRAEHIRMFIKPSKKTAPPKRAHPKPSVRMRRG